MVVFIFVTVSDNQFEHNLSLNVFQYENLVLFHCAHYYCSLLNINEAGSPH
jgi:hypothetical protein